MPQKFQPIGFLWRREATSAPTVEHASANSVDDTTRTGSGLCAAGARKPGVKKSSRRLDTISSVESVHKAQANGAEG